MKKVKSTFGSIIVGFLILTIGIICTPDTLEIRKRCTEDVTAVVIDVSENEKIDSRSKERKISYLAVISYDYNGRNYTQDMDFSSSKKTISTGIQ